MLCLSGFELYSSWVPLHKYIYSGVAFFKRKTWSLAQSDVCRNGDLKSLFYDITCYIIRRQWTSIRPLLESMTKTGLEIIHNDYIKRFKVQQTREKLRRGGRTAILPFLSPLNDITFVQTFYLKWRNLSNPAVLSNTKNSTLVVKTFIFCH